MTTVVNPERERIARLYAQKLGQDTDQPISAHVGRFADAILTKNAPMLEHLANGLNDKGKAVFTEVTGVRLPKTQSATWEAIKAWAGFSDIDDAQWDVRRTRESASKATIVESNGAAWVDKLRAEGFKRVATETAGSRKIFRWYGPGGRSYDLNQKAIDVRIRNYVKALARLDELTEPVDQLAAA